MKSILFDLDGTLVNSSPGIKAAFNYAFEKLQLPLQTDKQLSTFIGPPLEVTMLSKLLEITMVKKGSTKSLFTLVLQKLYKN